MSLRLLLVEDSPGDARLVHAWLAEADTDATVTAHVTTLAEARAHLEADSAAFDLVLLDLSLPDADGLTGVAALTGRHRPPVVVLTGRAESELADAAIRAGAQDYLLKGQVDGDLLARVLRHARERHAIASRLHRSEERLRLALEATNEGLWDWSVGEGTLYLSPVWWRMLGYEPREGLQSLATFQTLVHPEDLQRVMGNLEAYWANTLDDFHPEFRMRAADGGWRWILARARVVERDGDGHPLRMIGTHTDVTDRRRAEDELRDSEARFRTAIHEAPIPVMLYAEDGEILALSRTWTALTGYDPEDLPDLWAWLDQAYGPECQYGREVIRRVLDPDGPMAPDTFPVIGPDGRSLIWHVTPGALGHLPDGRRVAIVMANDITEWRRNQYLLRQARDRAETALADLHAAQDSLVEAEKMAGLGRLVAGVAHEINTPLGVAVTAASALGQRARQLQTAYADNTLSRSDFESFLQAVADTTSLLDTNLERAAELVQSFKQVSADQSSERRRVFDLQTYLPEVLTSLSPRLKSTPHTLTLDCPDPLVLDSYPGALFRVVTNLVINALVHGLADHPAGHITVSACPHGPEQVRLRVNDDGRGLTEEEQARVFEPFFTTRRGQGGTGLGMHIVYNVVRNTLGGQVVVESTPGVGARVVLTLPRTAPTVATDPTGQRHEPDR